MINQDEDNQINIMFQRIHQEGEHQYDNQSERVVTD